MAQFVVVVESPAKAKTIEKYLGKQYKVMASYGHVRDLVPKEGAVDPDHDFAMKYQVIERNQKHVDAIAKAVKNSEAFTWRLILIAKARPLPGMYWNYWKSVASSATNRFRAWCSMKSPSPRLKMRWNIPGKFLSI